MSEELDASNHEITMTARRKWLEELNQQAVRLKARLAIDDRDQARLATNDFAAGLPLPKSAVETLLLRDVLLDVAFRCGDLAHRRVHHSNHACSFSSAALLSHFWQADCGDIRSQFEAWHRALWTELNAIHPPTLASSIGRLVRRDYGRSWTLRLLSQRFQATSAQIRRAFQHEFGSTVRTHHRVARLLAALDILTTENVDAVASQVGFRSKKNFYRAFLGYVGMTPRQFKRLPPEEAAEVRRRVKEGLLRRT